jgi:hypothetical protein
VGEDGYAERRQVEGDPACLGVEAEDGHTLVAGIADQHDRRDAHGVQQEDHQHPEWNDQQGAWKVVVAAKQPEPSCTEGQEQSDPFEPGTLLGDLHGESPRAEYQSRGVAPELRNQRQQ